MRARLESEIAICNKSEKQRTEWQKALNQISTICDAFFSVCKLESVWPMIKRGENHGGNKEAEENWLFPRPQR